MVHRVGKRFLRDPEQVVDQFIREGGGLAGNLLFDRGAGCGPQLLDAMSDQNIQAIVAGERAQDIDRQMGFVAAVTHQLQSFVQQRPGPFGIALNGLLRGLKLQSDSGIPLSHGIVNIPRYAGALFRHGAITRVLDAVIAINTDEDQNDP